MDMWKMWCGKENLENLIKSLLHREFTQRDSFWGNNSSSFPNSTVLSCKQIYLTMVGIFLPDPPPPHPRLPHTHPLSFPYYSSGTDRGDYFRALQFLNDRPSPISTKLFYLKSGLRNIRLWLLMNRPQHSSYQYLYLSGFNTEHVRHYYNNNIILR